MGFSVGVRLGLGEGEFVGLFVWISRTGFWLGSPVRCTVDSLAGEGRGVGIDVGCFVGGRLGRSVGSRFGASIGPRVGGDMGSSAGRFVRDRIGLGVGRVEGLGVGCLVREETGRSVGGRVGAGTAWGSGGFSSRAAAAAGAATSPLPDWRTVISAQFQNCSGTPLPSGGTSVQLGSPG